MRVSNQLANLPLVFYFILVDLNLWPDWLVARNDLPKQQPIGHFFIQTNLIIGNSGLNSHYTGSFSPVGCLFCPVIPKATPYPIRSQNCRLKW